MVDQLTEFTEAFEEWKRLYDEDPESFQSFEEFVADPPKSYGDGAARYFIRLLERLDQLRSGAFV